MLRLLVRFLGCDRQPMPVREMENICETYSQYFMALLFGDYIHAVHYGAVAK